MDGWYRPRYHRVHARPVVEPNRTDSRNPAGEMQDAPPERGVLGEERLLLF